MLLIGTAVKPSWIAGAGLGLFSREAVKRGALVWAWDGRVDRIIPKVAAEQMPEAARAFLQTYATLRPLGWYLDGDNGRFINHSTRPNLAYDAFGRIVATSAIAEGEELTCDYATLAEVPSVGGSDGCASFANG